MYQQLNTVLPHPKMALVADPGGAQLHSDFLNLRLGSETVGRLALRVIPAMASEVVLKAGN